MLNKFIKLIFRSMKVGTHDGSFHCDEVLACAMLTNYVTKFKGAEIVRSRDPKVWETCDILVDVGGKYEPLRILDHHHSTFNTTYPNYDVRLSSAGLVYMHFPEIIPNIMDQILIKEANKLTFKPMRSPQIEDQIREKIYRKLIVYIDANDNGVEKVKDKEFTHVPTTLWTRISKLNPMWWQENVNYGELFLKGVQIAQKQLYDEVRQAFLGQLQTKQIVADGFKKRKEVHPSGRIVYLDKAVPWQKTIADIEKENDCEGEVLFIVSPYKAGNAWRIQAMSLKPGSFQLRKGLKEEWRGIKDMEKLINLSQIKDIQFVHASGFIGGAFSKQSAILMAQKSL